MCISTFDKSSSFYRVHTPIEYFWHYLPSVIWIILLSGLISLSTMMIFWTYKLIYNKGGKEEKSRLRRKMLRSIIFSVAIVVLSLTILTGGHIIGFDTLCF